MHHHDQHTLSDSRTTVERLENRLLLAATLLETGRLNIIGTVKADSIFVTYGPDRLSELLVRINKEEFSFRIADVTNIFVQAGALGDHIEFKALARNQDKFKIPTTIYGSTGDDLIIGPGSAARIYGGTGNDKIFGGFSRDIIYGEEGDDTIDGEQGNDYIRGGAGADRIIGGLGIDQMFGEEGNDTLISRADLPFRHDPRPLPRQDVFDLVDGGGGNDRADADSGDRLISVERNFKAF